MLNVVVLILLLLLISFCIWGLYNASNTTTSDVEEGTADESTSARREWLQPHDVHQQGWTSNVGYASVE